MIVKIGDEWFDSEEQPICVWLSDTDKENITAMHHSAQKYACFPENTKMTVAEKLKWMGDWSERPPGNSS